MACAMTSPAEMIDLTRSLRSLRSAELIVLRAPAEPAPSALLYSAASR